MEVGGEAASEQVITHLRDPRALLLRSNTWTKSRLPLCDYYTPAYHKIVIDKGSI